MVKVSHMCVRSQSIIYSVVLLSLQYPFQFCSECYKSWHKMITEDVKAGTWEPDAVIDSVLKLVNRESASLPCEINVGIDSKFVLIFLRIIPIYFRLIISSITNPCKPAIQLINNKKSK